MKTYSVPVGELRDILGDTGLIETIKAKLCQHMEDLGEFTMTELLVHLLMNGHRASEQIVACAVWDSIERDHTIKVVGSDQGSAFTDRTRFRWTGKAVSA